MKEIFEELKRAAEEARRTASPPAQEPLRPPVHQERRPTPPPLAPSAPARGQAPPVLPPALARPPGVPLPLAPKVESDSHADASRRAAAAYTGSKEPTRKPHPLTALLHTPEGYRQAFILKEVLDTPNGLKKSPWDE